MFPFFHLIIPSFHSIFTFNLHLQVSSGMFNILAMNMPVNRL